MSHLPTPKSLSACATDAVAVAWPLSGLRQDTRSVPAVPGLSQEERQPEAPAMAAATEGTGVEAVSAQAEGGRMTARSTWKGAERRVAADLGGARVPVTGIDRAGADVRTPLFSVQVKLRRSLPGWLWDWLGGIRASAKSEGRVGILVLKKPRQADAEGLVVLSYSDFVDLHGAVRHEGEE